MININGFEADTVLAVVVMYFIVLAGIAVVSISSLVAIMLAVKWIFF